jgi:bifunctional non-homologous end joining protein LigD
MAFGSPPGRPTGRRYSRWPMTVLMPEPMLAKSGPLPQYGDYAYELKWDGFRALVRSGDAFRVRSRRGWDMTKLLPELAELPVEAVLDGEIVALGSDGKPVFERVCQRLLHGDRRIALRFVCFDLLALNGESLLERPYAERQEQLASLGLDGEHWQTQEVFADGEALFAAACEHGLEGIVCKLRSDRYRPGERRWLKVKNRAYYRFEQERELARRWR